MITFLITVNWVRYCMAMDRFILVSLVLFYFIITAHGNDVQAVALSVVGKPTKQSTTYNPNYSSDKAVDGSQDTQLYPNNVCSHTNEEVDPWWRVDLEGEHCISKVTVLNRGDCCSDRLTHAVVRAGLNDDIAANEQCGSEVTEAQAQPLGGTIEFNCDPPLLARYVSVDIPTKSYLQLCEVTVKELVTQGACKQDWQIPEEEHVVNEDNAVPRELGP